MYLNAIIEKYLNKADEKHKEGLEHKIISNDCFCEEEKYRNLYRVESVNRVLDFIRTEYNSGRVCDLDKLLCHCQNKLNGNIDGVELPLDENYRGVDFIRKETEGNQ